ncbi:MAG: hypothetical protein RL398_1902 [Planctomycetota bacterium]|jgi:hypothetical protein
MQTAADFADPVPNPPRPVSVGNQPSVAPWLEAVGPLLPGIVHQLGNLLFTIQGNAHLHAGTPEGDAIQRAAGRGAGIVTLLRGMLGDAIPQPVSADELLHMIVELTRVGLRERGCQLTVGATPDAPSPSVDLQRAAQMVLVCLQHFVQGLPAGTLGAVTVARVPVCSGAFRVRFGFVPAEDQLPFPVLNSDLVGVLVAAGRRHGIRLVPALRTSGFEVELPVSVAHEP